MMFIFLDLIVVVVIAIFAFIAAKKGFVCTIIEIVGFIAAILLANSLSPMISDYTYDKFVQPAIVESVKSIEFDEASIEAATVEVPENAFPKFVYKILGDNFDIANFQKAINNNLSEGIETAMATACEEMFKPAIMRILGLIFTLIIVSVLLAIVKLIARIINKMVSIHIVGKLNKILGACLGIIKGVAVAAIFCSIAALIVSVLPNGIFIFTQENINATFLFKLLTFSI